jgi:F-type H+-transporting ATPase subunit b
MNIRFQYRRCGRWLAVLCAYVLAVGVAPSGLGTALFAASADGGPPMGLRGDLSLFTIFAFALFLWVLGKLAWKPMIEGLDKRESGIRKAIEDAEENRRKSEALLADYQKKLRETEQTVQAMVAEARRDAERTGKDLIASAQKEVDQIRIRAREEIRQAKDTALAEVFSQVNSQVILAAEQVLGRALADADQDRLVSEALAHISR